MRMIALALAFGYLFTLPAAARDLTVILHRGANGTEMFLSAPAQALFDLTGTPVQVVPGGGGQVDIGQFATGTWQIGDALLARSAVRIGDAPARFEAMSFMLHDRAEDLPLKTPLDAVIAIELCSVVAPGTVQDWASLIGYAGYFSTRSALDAPISLELPARRTVEVTVIDAGPEGQNVWRTTLSPGAPLVIPPSLPQRAGLLPLVLAGLLGALGLAVLGTLWRRNRAPQPG